MNSRSKHDPLSSIVGACAMAAFFALLAPSLALPQEKPAPATKAPPSAGVDASKAPAVTPEQAQEIGRVLDDEVVARTKSKDPREVATKIAGEYGGDADQILRDKKESKVSWGGMMIAQEIARTSGRPVGEILAQKKAGQGWGKIAQDHGLKLGEVLRSAGDRAEKLGLADKAKMQERYRNWEARQAKQGAKEKTKGVTAPGVTSGSSSGAAVAPAGGAGTPAAGPGPVSQPNAGGAGKSKDKGKSGK